MYRVQKELLNYRLHCEEGLGVSMQLNLRSRLLGASEFTQWLCLRHAGKRLCDLEVEIIVAELNIFRSTYASLLDTAFTSDKKDLSDVLNVANFSEKSNSLLKNGKQKSVLDLIIQYAQSLPSYDVETMSPLRESIIASGRTIGLFATGDFTSINTQLIGIMQALVNTPEHLTYAKLVATIKERDALRASKEYAHADYLLSLLNLHGFEINDSVDSSVASVDSRWRFSL